MYCAYFEINFEFYASVQAFNDWCVCEARVHGF